MRGTYIIIVKVKKNLKNVKIGSLGKLDFKKGFYCYVGSALGKSVNLENRLKRHFEKKKKLRWHIDYLLANHNVLVDGAIIFPSRRRIECSVSRKIEKQADETINKFGSSDCSCRGHLHYFRKRKDLISTLDKIP